MFFSFGIRLRVLLQMVKIHLNSQGKSLQFVLTTPEIYFFHPRFITILRFYNQYYHFNNPTLCLGILHPVSK